MPHVDGVAYWFPKAPHAVSKVIAQAFAKGARANWIDVIDAPFPENICDSWFSSAAKIKPSFYGILHGGKDLVEKCIEGFNYIDHGYWGKSPSLATLTGNFRIVRNALQHSCVTKNKPVGRFESSGVVFEPLRNWGRRYLVAIPPTDHQVNFYGERIAKDFEEKLAAIRDDYRETRISRKGDKISLTEHLKHASFALGFNSTGLFEAARLGIPVITTGPSPLSELHDCFDAKEWEEKRLAIFRGCADRQFTLAEIANGTAYRTLEAIGEL